MKQYNLDIDNRSLVEECRNGNKDAMSILYTRFAPRMLHVIRRYVADNGDAHDILHDGFIAAFTRLDSLRDPDRLEYWLATIMKNLSLKFLQEQNLASILDEIPDVMDEPEIGNLIDMDILESLITKLPDGYQKVFRLAVLENKSHKEISKILGIAPNSSSSQLFHAKVQLRKLIVEYKYSKGLICILAMLCISGIFLTLKNRTDKVADTPVLSSVISSAEKSFEDPALASNQNPTPAVQMPQVAQQSRKKPVSMTSTPQINAVTSTSIPVSLSPDSISQKEQASDNGANLLADDNLAENKPKPISKDSIVYPQDFRNPDLLYAEAMPRKSRSKGWSAGIAFDPGIQNFNGGGSNISGDMSQNTPPDLPDDNPGDNPDNPKKAPHRSNPDLARSLSDKAHRNYMPVSFGISAERHFSTLLGIETGIAYTYLRTDFEDNRQTSSCHWHYLDIPLKANLYFYKADRFRIYGSVGGKFSIPVYSRADGSKQSDSSGTAAGSFRSNCVWAIGGGIGVSFQLSDRIGIYIEPTVQYHFPHNDKVPNIWTDEPWGISLPIGFRFNW